MLIPATSVGEFVDAGTESVRLAKSGVRSRGATSTCALAVVRGLAADPDVYGHPDLFRDENIEYAQKLMAAGVSELSVHPGLVMPFKG